MTHFATQATPQAHPPRRTRAVAAIVLLASTLALGGLSGCNQNTPADLSSIAPEAVVEVKVEPAERILFVTRNRTVAQFATDSYTIFRDLKAHFESQYRAVPHVAVQAITDVENQAGQSFENEPIFEVSWNRSQLDPIDFTKNLNVFTEDVLAAAQSVRSFNLAGDYVLMEYCMSTGSKNAQEIFCNKVIEGLYNK